LNRNVFFGYSGADIKECLSDMGATIPQKRVSVYAWESAVDKRQDAETQRIFTVMASVA